VKYRAEANEFEGDGHDGLAQVMWHVTDVCPLSCPYCFATKTSQSVEPAEIGPLCQVLHELGVLKVDIGGGEPMTFRHLPQVVESLSGLDIETTITTSGTGTHRQLDWLLGNLHIFSRVIISIDGPESIHDSLRGRKGSYLAAIELVRQVAASPVGRLRVNTVITPQLLNDSVLIALASDLAPRGPLEWCLIQPHEANATAGFSRYAVSDSDFSSAVRRAQVAIAGPSVPVSLVSRSRNDYTGYWVLYPDRSLRQHTDGPEDYVAAMDVLSTDVATIRDEILRRGQSVPLRTI
jgi:molybdenum cofactor biosynthesis enzyme MoaA